MNYELKIATHRGTEEKREKTINNKELRIKN
jgi:hypothetical protein